MKLFIKKNWALISSVVLFFADWILLNVAFLIALWLRFGGIELFHNYTRPFVFMNAIFPFFAVGIGLFRSLHTMSMENQRSYFKRLVVYMGIVTLAFLFTIKGYFYSRQVMISTFIVYFFLLEMNHSLFRRFQNRLVKKGLIGYRCLIVGVDTSAFKFAQDLNRTFGDYYKILGFVKNFHGREHKIHEELKDHILGEREDFERLLNEYKPDVVFIVSDSMKQEKYETIHDLCEKYNVKLKMVSPYVRYILSHSRIRDVSGVPLVHESWRTKHKKMNAGLKRVFDIVFTLGVGIILLPVGLIIALIIKLTSKGPVFFKQKRSLYKGGPEFDFYKFRTMYENADQMKEKLLKHNESNGALFKMKNDPRVTPVGRFLRKYSLDEIPQFINVLKGEMSIIGPRPLPVKDFDHIQNGKMNYDWYKKRGEAKPGISGLWQVAGRSNLSFEEMLFLDLYYVENQSIFLDMEIIFETIPVVLFGKGAY